MPTRYPPRHRRDTAEHTGATPAPDASAPEAAAATDATTTVATSPEEQAAADAKRARIESIVRTAMIFIMPLIFVGMMITSYLGTMHSPTPRDMPVVVAGAQQDSGAVATALREAHPDALDVETVDNAHEARSRVLDRKASAAVVTDDGAHATLYTADAAGPQQVTVVTGLVSPVLQGQGMSVGTEDLAPLPADDPAGLAAMFLMTSIVMAGYLPFSVLRSNSPELLKFRRIVPLIAAWAAVIAGLEWTIAVPLLGVVDAAHSFAVLGIAWLGVFAIASVQLFITRLVGALGVILGILFLMSLGLPSSNMAMPVYTMPAFFRFTHEILPMPAIGESLRSALYFGGDGVAEHLLVLAIGAVVGLVLTRVYDHRQHRKNPHPQPLDVTTPSIHGGRRPDSKVVRYASVALFPLAMVAMMLTFMLGAMHSPSPHEMPVAVVGSSAEQTETTIARLQQSMGDGFDFTAADDVDDARALVEDRDDVAALVLPSAQDPEFRLIGNQAANNSAFRVVSQAFGQVASAQHTDLRIEDVAPLPERDSNGVVVMYVAMGWILAGFMVVIVGANAAPSSRPLRRMIPLTAAYAPFMAFVVDLIAGPITGAVSGHFAPLWGTGTIAIFCVAMFAMVFERLIGMFAIIPVIGTLMFAGVPASNGGVSQYMTPGFFSALHDVLPMPAAVELVRSIVYFQGDQVWEHLQVLGVWGLVSLVAVIVIDSIRPPRTEHDFGNLAQERDRQVAGAQDDAGSDGEPDGVEVSTCPGDEAPRAGSTAAGERTEGARHEEPVTASV